MQVLDVETHIIALACSDPPKGNSKWTQRFLADQCFEFNYAESMSHVTGSRVLKNEFKPHLKNAGVYRRNITLHLLLQWKMYSPFTAGHRTMYFGIVIYNARILLLVINGCSTDIIITKRMQYGKFALKKRNENDSIFREGLPDIKKRGRGI